MSICGECEGTMDGICNECRDGHEDQELVELRAIVAALPKCNRLAYACAQAVMRQTIGSRSAISDALLDFLEVGGLDGPKTVPEWMAIYEAAQAAEEEKS